MNPTVIGWAIVAALLSGGGGFLWGDSRGHDRGVLETQASHDASQVKTLSQGLTDLSQAVADSATASKNTRAALTTLEQINKTSTAELKNALAKSRPPGGPVVCRIDADSMRILAAAADRADALAAGGLAAGRAGGTVSAGGSAGRRQ